MKRLLTILSMVLISTVLVAAEIHLKKTKKPDPFFDKHRAEAADMVRKPGVHQPVLEGNCSACHKSPKDPSKLKAGFTKLCIQCHADRGRQIKKKTAHPPLQDCDNCHQPHASENRPLLLEPVKDLCLGCHDPEEEALLKDHYGMIPTSLACTECHTPHAGKKKGLLWSGTVHDAFSDCSVCHEKAGKDGKIKLLHDGYGNNLCGECHDDIVDESKEAKFKHKPTKWGACWECHSPHVSRDRNLMRKETVNETCRSCHKHLRKENHPVFRHKTRIEELRNPLDKSREFDCDSCHDPHGSDHERLRTAPEKGFCKACHEEKF